MPGVPSGRGCNACRKQKKKCDQSKPSCSRCSRLHIACVGGGEQRYKFKQEMIAPASTDSLAVTRPISAPRIELSRSPSNEMNTLASSFTSLLLVSDLRYSLTPYGGFLQDVPRRLGENEALDAAVSALTCAFPSVYTHHQSQETLAIYGNALKTLRTTLSDPFKALSANTLSALYLTMICHNWIGREDDQYTGHGEALAHLLSSAAFQGWEGTFESELLLTLCVPVIIEMAFNPRVELKPWFGKLIETYGFDGGDSLPSLKLNCLAQMPSFIHYPELHLPDMQSTYDLVRADFQELRQLLQIVTGAKKSGAPWPLPASTPPANGHCLFQTAYGILLTEALILNDALRAYDPEDYILVQEAADFHAEALSLAEEAFEYRPLGATYIPMMLVSAWAATDERSKQNEIELMLAEYQNDFARVNLMNSAASWKAVFYRRRARMVALKHQMPLDDGFNESVIVSDVAEPIEVGDGQCCIM